MGWNYLARDGNHLSRGALAVTCFDRYVVNAGKIFLLKNTDVNVLLIL